MADQIFCLRMDEDTGEARDSNGGNDGRGNDLPENTELGQWPVGHAINQERQHCQKKLVSWLKRLRDSFNGGGSLSTFGNT